MAKSERAAQTDAHAKFSGTLPHIEAVRSAASSAAASTAAVIRSRTDCADIARIGIPRALLYYRYGALWTTFFEQIGREVVVSDASDKNIYDAGERVSVDECCLASKLYLGHVESLIGACDAVFVPSLANKGRRKGYCTKYQALPDLVANTFYDASVRVVSLSVNETDEKVDEGSAFAALGQRFGASAADAKRAYRAASAAQQRSDRSAAASLRNRPNSLTASAGPSAACHLACGASLCGARSVYQRRHRRPARIDGRNGAFRRRDRS